MRLPAKARWLLGAGLILLLSLASLALVVAGRAEKVRKSGGPMTREETGKLVEAYGRSLGPGVSYPQDGGMMHPSGVVVWFEYTEHNAFICRVLVDDLEPLEGSAGYEPEILEGMLAEERSGTPTGGARLEWVPETQRLFLSRTYLERVDEKTFIADMNRLVEAGLHWGRDVFDRVIDRIQAKRAQPAPR